MTQDTFRLINCFFQIGASISMNNDDKKERTKLELLLKPMDLFTKYYEPSPAVCFDEIMVSFQGRFKFLVYCPQKPNQWGIKFYSLCDSKNGYCMGLTPSFGKLDGTLEKIIDKHLQVWKDKHIQFFFCDNFYTTIQLAITLKNKYKLVLCAEIENIYHQSKKKFLKQINGKFLSQVIMVSELVVLSLKRIS